VEVVEAASEVTEAASSQAIRSEVQPKALSEVVTAAVWTAKWEPVCEAVG
jgi:hypothetical protein